MDSWDVRLIGASYKKVADNLLMIELYGKTSSGNSITIRHFGFEPYFYVGEPSEALVRKLETNPDVRYIERDELIYDNAMHPVIRVVTTYPWVVPDFRNSLKDKWKVFAADIPFHHRFIYDMNLSSCIRVYGEKTKGNYTTDIVIDAIRFEEIKPFNPPLKILSFDIEASIKYGNIYCICYTIQDDDEVIDGEPIYGNERDIITAFIETINYEDPDVITGYNINNYDIPKLIERAKECGIENIQIGRDGGELRNVMGKFWRLNGRLVADAWWSAKTELKPKRETLNFVSKLLFNEEKMDVNPSKIDAEWENDRDKVLKYCLKDAQLAMKILIKIGILRKVMDLATVSRLPMDDVLNVGNSNLIDSLLIREVDRNRMAVPLTRKAEEKDSIEGAYVHTIEAGLFNWVCVLDFKSMYPSIIITKNICFTTQSDDGTILSPVGCKFLSSAVRPGILPSILKELMTERDRIKKLIKESTNEIDKNYYDGLQGAIKILMNAFYGVFASSFYRFTDNNIGGSVTGFARDITKGIIEKTKAMGLNVVYSDTDSIFVQSPHNNLEETVKFGMGLSDRFSMSGILLQFEKIINPLFSHGKKKRYIGKVVWPEENTVVRGYEIRRTDSFDLQSETLMKIFEQILNGDSSGAIATARESVAKTLRGEVELDKLIISKGCKEFCEYVRPNSQASVQTAKKLQDSGYEFVPGMKVSWIVVNGNESPQVVEPYIAGEKFKYTPDYKYYAKRLANTLARATEAFGWTEKDLIENTKQTRLFGMAHKEKMRNKEWGVKKVDKELKLEDFL